MLSDQLVRLLEFLQLRVKRDSLIQHVVLDVGLCSLLKLALQRKHFRLQPHVIKVPHLVHLISCFAQVDKRKFLDVAESFPRNYKVLRK